MNFGARPLLKSVCQIGPILTPPNQPTYHPKLSKPPPPNKNKTNLLVNLTHLTSPYNTLLHISPQKYYKKMRHIIHYIIPLTIAITLSVILKFKNHSHSTLQPLPPFSCNPNNPSTTSLPFCNTLLPINDRAVDLVSRLTLDEKISQLVNKAAAIPRLGIPYYQWWSEALHGVAMADGVENGFAFNGTIQAATSFPQVILTAAAFDDHLWYRIAKVSTNSNAAMLVQLF